MKRYDNDKVKDASVSLLETMYGFEIVEDNWGQLITPYIILESDRFGRLIIYNNPDEDLSELMNPYIRQLELQTKIDYVGYRGRGK